MSCPDLASYNIFRRETERDTMDDIREAKPLTIKRRGDDGKRLIRCAFRRNCCKS